MFVTLCRVEQLTPYIWTFWFKPDKPIRFQAGQYFEIHIPHNNVDNRGDKRWLTISSTPQEPYLGVTVRFAKSNGSTYKHALKHLPIGTRLYASEPIGDFVLPKDPSVPVVFIATGIGSTPVHSMVKSVINTKETRNLHLIHGVHVAQDLVFDELFRSCKITYSPTVSNPDKKWQGKAGRLNAPDILALVGDPNNKLFYFSGPEDFIMQLVYDLHMLGLRRDQVVLDYFPGYKTND